MHPLLGWHYLAEWCLMRKDLGKKLLLSLHYMTPNQPLSTSFHRGCKPSDLQLCPSWLDVRASIPILLVSCRALLHTLAFLPMILTSFVSRQPSSYWNDIGWNLRFCHMSCNMLALPRCWVLHWLLQWLLLDCTFARGIHWKTWSTPTYPQWVQFTATICGPGPPSIMGPLCATGCHVCCSYQQRWWIKRAAYASQASNLPGYDSCCSEQIKAENRWRRMEQGCHCWVGGQLNILSFVGR